MALTGLFRDFRGWPRSRARLGRGSGVPGICESRVHGIPVPERYPACAGCISERPCRAGSGDQRFVKPDLHGPGHADADAQFTCAASVLVEKNLHLRSLDVKGAGGTDCCAGTALETFFIIPFDFLTDADDLDTEVLQIAYSFIEIVSFPVQFEHHEAFFPGIDCRLEDTEGQIEFPDKVDGYGFIDNFFRKSQRQYLGVHGFSSFAGKTVYPVPKGDCGRQDRKTA